MTTHTRTTKKFRALCAGTLLLLPLLSLTGCGGDTSAKESDDMRKAMQGKDVGPMPADIKAKMDASMKGHGPGGGAK